jgi:hypothetical protein
MKLKLKRKILVLDKGSLVLTSPSISGVRKVNLFQRRSIVPLLPEVPSVGNNVDKSLHELILKFLPLIEGADDINGVFNLDVTQELYIRADNSEVPINPNTGKPYENWRLPHPINYDTSNHDQRTNRGGVGILPGVKVWYRWLDGNPECKFPHAPAIKSATMLNITKPLHVEKILKRSKSRIPGRVSHNEEIWNKVCFMGKATRVYQGAWKADVCSCCLRRSHI